MALQPFKPWKSFADQVQLLEQRGMIFNDKQQAEKELARIGYYRLSGYWYPFRRHLPLPQPKSQTSTRSDYFVDNTEFHHVVQLYDFDNAIKLLALEAIQHIEIAMRTQISYVLGQRNPIAHLHGEELHIPQVAIRQGTNHDDWTTHENWLSDYYSKMQRELNSDQQSQAHSGFVLHNKKQYGTLPIWAACEIWDFGAMSKLYAQMKPHDKQTIEHEFNLFNDELSGHLKAFNFVRNIAAHHGRLWNRHLINRPSIGSLIDANNPQWGNLTDPKSYSYCINHVFVRFCLMQRMLKVICPMSDWGVRFQTVLKQFPNHSANTMEVSLDKMGMGGLSLTDLSAWDLWK